MMAAFNFDMLLFGDDKEFFFFFLFLSLSFRHINPPPFSLRSSTSVQLTVPPGSACYHGEPSFPKLWNYLPPDLCNIDSLPTFKSKLKTHLFKVTFFSLVSLFILLSADTYLFIVLLMYFFLFFFIGFCFSAQCSEFF